MICRVYKTSGDRYPEVNLSEVSFEIRDFVVVISLQEDTTIRQTLQNYPDLKRQIQAEFLLDPRSGISRGRDKIYRTWLDTDLQDAFERVFHGRYFSHHNIKVHSIETCVLELQGWVHINKVFPGSVTTYYLQDPKSFVWIDNHGKADFVPYHSTNMADLVGGMQLWLHQHFQWKWRKELMTDYVIDQVTDQVIDYVTDHE